MKPWVRFGALAAGAMFVALGARAAITPLEQLVETDRSFSQTSIRLGVPFAFGMFLAPGSMTLRPRPVDARQWMRDHLLDRRTGDYLPDIDLALVPADSLGRLTWEPSFARVSRMGDFGVTSGPWVHEPADTGRPKSHGHYLTVWERQTQEPAVEQMRVIFDAGVSHPPVENEAPRDFRADWTTGEFKILLGGDRKKVEDSMLAAERQLEKRSARGRYAEGFAALAAPDVRLFRPGIPPLVGTATALERIRSDPRPWRWTPHGASVARSGDLGFAYGIAVASRGSGTDSASYVRVWQRDRQKRWRLIADLQLPIEPGAS